MPLFESHPGSLGVVAVAVGVPDFEHDGEGLVAGRTGGGICVAFAGVAAFLLVLVLGRVFVGVGAVVSFGQFAMFVCVSPGFGGVHCALLRSLFGLDVVADAGLVTVGLVCA